MKISVTHLSSYSYCPRKLYLDLVKGYVEPPKDVLVKGTIRHETYELINNSEEEIVTNLREADFDAIFSIYKQKHSAFLRSSITNNKAMLKQVGLNPSDLFKQVWPLIMAESMYRAENISSFIQKHETFGKELWDMLTPKIISELKLESDALQLKGRIDCLEDHGNEYVPVELKTGKIPPEGVWPSHKVQIGAYALLIEDAYGIRVTRGYVDYLDSGQKQRREVRMNPFLADEIRDLIKKVQVLIKSEQAPDVCANKNKCNSCGLKEQCQNA